MPCAPIACSKKRCCQRTRTTAWLALLKVTTAPSSASASTVANTCATRMLSASPAHRKQADVLMKNGLCNQYTA